MDKNKCKFLCLDVDGTLTNSKHELSSVNKEALIKAQRAGIKVVLASARPVFGMKSIAKELELDRYGGFLLAFNGGKILNFQTGEVIFELNFPNEFISKVYQSAKDNNLAILSFSDEQVIAEDDENEYVKLIARVNGASIRKANNFLSELSPHIAKFLILGDPPEIEMLETKMKLEVGDHLSIYRSMPFCIEILAKGIDKGASLERLAVHLGLTMKQKEGECAPHEEKERTKTEGIIGGKDDDTGKNKGEIKGKGKDGGGGGGLAMVACGDGLNDISMLTYAEFGVAMGNAPDVVKDAADFVTLTNDEDGVAYVIEKFLLGKTE